MTKQILNLLVIASIITSVALLALTLIVKSKNNNNDLREIINKRFDSLEVQLYQRIDTVDNRISRVEQQNKMILNEEIEIIGPSRNYFT